MTVGEALTAARYQAGLSVEELSERTRIRGTIIRSIEQDDYEACGGDLYVRGYVRSIAGAVGIDAQPLIREYELGRSGAANGTTAGSTTSGSAASDPIGSPTGSGLTGSGPTGRHAESYPRAAPPQTAQTASDQSAAATETQTPSGPSAVPDVVPVQEPPARQPPAQDSPVQAPRAQEPPAQQAPPVQDSPAQELPAQQTPARQRSAPQTPVPLADLDATRYDMPAVTADPAMPAATADPAVTSYDLPRVSDLPPSAEPPTVGFAASDSPTAEFPGLLSPAPMPVPPTPVPPTPVPPTPVPPTPVPSTPVPSTPVPPRVAETRYDLTAIPEEPSPAATEDLMAAGYDLGPTETPVDAQAGTQILPAIGYGQAPSPAGAGRPAPGPPGAARKKRRGLLAVAAVVVVVALGALGFSLASRGGNLATGTVTSPSTSAAANASASAAARAKASAAAQASARAAAQASASAAAQASASASPSAGAQHITRLPVASVMAFGPDGTADGDNPGMAANAVSTSPSSSWATQWYTTPQFGMLKHGTGLLLDLGGKVTVTTVRLELSPYRPADLQLRVGNDEALSALQTAATANDVGGTLKLTLHHPVAARYLLIWFTQLPPNGAGHYQETVSEVSVAGHR